MLGKVLKLEFIYQFRSGYAFFGYVIGIFINLLVYFYTSKTFIPQPDIIGHLYGKDYFQFIVFGELGLLMAQVAISEGQEAYFRYKESGVLEQFYFSRNGLLSSSLQVYISLNLIQSIFAFFTILFSIIAFGVELDISFISRVLITFVIGAFLFLGFFFLNVAISAYMGRRNGSIHHVVNILSFFSGAYFPLEIFSNELLKNILSLSPLALLLEWYRSYVYNNIFLWKHFLMLMISCFFVPGIVAFVMFRYVLKERNYVSP